MGGKSAALYVLMALFIVSLVIPLVSSEPHNKVISDTSLVLREVFGLNTRVFRVSSISYEGDVHPVSMDNIVLSNYEVTLKSNDNYTVKLSIVRYNHRILGDVDYESIPPIIPHYVDSPLNICYRGIDHNAVELEMKPINAVLARVEHVLPELYGHEADRIVEALSSYLNHHTEKYIVLKKITVYDYIGALMLPDSIRLEIHAEINPNGLSIDVLNIYLVNVVKLPLDVVMNMTMLGLTILPVNNSWIVTSFGVVPFHFHVYIKNKPAIKGKMKE